MGKTVGGQEGSGTWGQNPAFVLDPDPVQICATSSGGTVALPAERGEVFPCLRPRASGAQVHHSSSLKLKLDTAQAQQLACSSARKDWAGSEITGIKLRII